MRRCTTETAGRFVMYVPCVSLWRKQCIESEKRLQFLTVLTEGSTTLTAHRDPRTLSMWSLYRWSHASTERRYLTCTGELTPVLVNRRLYWWTDACTDEQTPVLVNRRLYRRDGLVLPAQVNRDGFVLPVPIKRDGLVLTVQVTSELVLASSGRLRALQVILGGVEGSSVLHRGLMWLCLIPVDL